MREVDVDVLAGAEPEVVEGFEKQKHKRYSDCN